MTQVSDRFPFLVRQLRKARGWSQEQLAGEADLNRSYVGEIERGIASPSLCTAAKIAQAFGLNLSALLARCEDEAGGQRRGEAHSGNELPAQFPSSNMVFDGYSRLREHPHPE
ncbi:helix-turn-helix domain-containing protein [Rhodocyclus purpureus]|jgi:transcriptional regulator with XRE-family HTH domain|uniref:helix-turn-helix domain-containing protein n=1 Tax=Rhodocyclus purpureus TaxID=1067 RepID=UPI0019135BBB|nr:helix-turn-helix transcriptional regulator [Rhodocyclus purpureus]MBK5914811.1 hypothetical protein [Rhodocyclus purpureus]